MDSTDEVPNSSRTLLQPGLCRQNQPVPIKLESLDQQQLGSRDSDEGISHPSHVQSGPTCTASFRLPTRDHTDSSCRSKQSSICPGLPQVSILTCSWSPRKVEVRDHHQPQIPEQICEIRAFFQDVGPAHSQSSSPEERLMAKIDLKDAFFMVPIAPQFCKFLLFSVGMQTYQFSCLPFGLCTAPRLFTKVLKPVVERLRSIGIRLVIYIDNMLLMAPSSTLLREQVFATLFLLENTGFVINNKKSLLQPTQEIEFLEMIIDSVKMDLRLPGEKIKNIRQEAQKVLSLFSPSAHSLSQLAGKLNATTPALQMAPLFCRSLQTCLKQALAANSQDYKSPVQLSPQAKEDLWWWVYHLSTWNGRSLIVQQASMTIILDASLQGWGATCNGVWTRGPWSSQEQTLHINCLELLAATLAVHTFAKERSGITILL